MGIEAVPRHMKQPIFHQQGDVVSDVETSCFGAILKLAGLTSAVLAAIFLVIQIGSFH